MKVPDVRGAVTRNWPQKATALILAAVLWALTEAEEPTTQLVPVRVNIQPPPGRALTLSVPQVQALYSGPTRELIKLFASPPTISRQIPDTASSPEFTLTLTPADLSLDIEASVQPLDVQPRVITLVLDDMARRTVAVVTRVSIETDPGFDLMSGIAVVPESLAITGPRMTVERVDSVFTLPLELTRVRAPVRQTVEIDTTSLGNLRLSRSTVTIAAEVGRITERVLMGIPIRIQGEPSVAWIANPPAVTVIARGPATRLTSLTRDSVQATALPQGTGDREVVHLSVRGPAGLEFVASPDSVLVQSRDGT